MSWWRMSRRFNRIYQNALKPENRIPFSAETDRIVVFSDHHKGDGSAADDFLKNAAVYSEALSHYRSEGFRLVVLGDNEELWENRIDQILPHHREVIQQEIAMAPESPDGKKIRVWGNHDKEVSLRRFRRICRKRKLRIFDGVDYREGVCLGEDIFCVHGHQGRFFEDRAWRLSRWAVQVIWKTIQMIFRIGVDGPAENARIRDDLEAQYYRWAKKKRLLLICGHTHRVMFASLTYPDLLRQGIFGQTTASEAVGAEKTEGLSGMIRREGGQPVQSLEPDGTWPVPCYFNDGCCGYTDGITCLELDRGTARLVQWGREDFRRKVLAEGRLLRFFASIKEGRTVDTHIGDAV
ncbi:MAG: metallophosphoesterase [Candidatus Aminicenantales bacterium]